jgi:hypothetical protein
MVLATAFDLSNLASILLAVALAFVFGYGLTMQSLVGAVGLRRALRLSLASDTVSITSMEVVDNLFVVGVPGALAARLSDALFWWSLGVSLVVAFCGYGADQPLVDLEGPGTRCCPPPAQPLGGC